MDVALEKAFEEFTFEYNILKKILHRNNNQHGDSLIFVQLQVTSRQIAPSISNDRISILTKTIKECLRFNLQNNQKITEVIVNKFLLTIQLIVMYIESYCKAMVHGERALYYLYRQFNRKLFPILYGILYANMSKMMDIMYSQVILPLLDIQEQLKTQLQVSLYDLSHFLIMKMGWYDLYR